MDINNRTPLILAVFNSQSLKIAVCIHLFFQFSQMYSSRQADIQINYFLIFP